MPVTVINFPKSKFIYPCSGNVLAVLYNYFMNESESPNQSESVAGSPKRNRWVVWLVFAILATVYLLVSRPADSISKVPWLTDLQVGLAQAKQNNQLVLIDFYADWCSPCRRMDEEVFTRDDVADALSDWVPVKINTSKQPDISDRYYIEVLPTFIILSPQGKALKTTEGSMSAGEFIRFIESANKAYQ